MSTPFTATTTVVVSPLAASFVFSDTFDFSGFSISYYEVLITPPSGILYTIQLTGLVSNIPQTVLPSQLGFTGSTLGDGVYKMEIRIHQTGDATNVYTSLELDTIVDYTLKQTLDPIIARLSTRWADNDTIVEEERVNEVFSMWLQLQGAYLLVSYGALVDAQQVINTLTNYTTGNFCWDDI